jgi:tetratricopeptide (TPR) repeat protein
MRRASALALVAAALACAFAPATSLADTPPGRWDIAKDPAARNRWALHVTVRELIVQNRQLGSNGAGRALVDATLQRARALLEDAHAAASPDIVLRFDLGEVYYQLDHYEQAIAVLKPALELAPNHPAATESYLSLAYAYAKLGRSREERDCYRKYLARTIDDRTRALALLNLAEAEMHLGDLPEAIATYHEAIDTAAHLPNSSSAAETSILAVWGLAVAIDRNGDSGGALAEAKLATQMDPGEQLIAHGANVFFVPEYEREWYLALGASVHAKEAKFAEEAALAWGVVEEHWSRYANAASPDDRWRELARTHQAKAHAAKLDAQKRMPKRDGAARLSNGSPNAGSIPRVR